MHEDLVRYGQLSHIAPAELDVQHEPGVRAVTNRVVPFAALPPIRRVPGPGERAAGEAALGAQSEFMLAEPSGFEQHMCPINVAIGPSQVAARNYGRGPVR